MRNLSELRCWLRDADIKESKGGREEEEEEKRSNFQNMKKEQRKIKQKEVKIRSKSRLKKRKYWYGHLLFPQIQTAAQTPKLALQQIF